MPFAIDGYPAAVGDEDDIDGVPMGGDDEGEDVDGVPLEVDDDIDGVPFEG